MTSISRLPTKVKVVLTMLISIAAILIIAGFVMGRYPGPAQPVPFSHRIHASTKQIGCFFCHPDASRSSSAGLPSVEKCMLCHKVIASNFRPIAKLRGYYSRNEPVPWVRVTTIPDFVHFSHQCHIAAKHDCSECHGNVRRMDRVTLVNDFSMGFCVDCHWKNKVSVTCFTCHY